MAQHGDQLQNTLAECRRYITSHLYITADDRDLQPKLQQALPRVPMQSELLQSDDVTASLDDDDALIDID